MRFGKGVMMIVLRPVGKVIHDPRRPFVFVARTLRESEARYRAIVEATPDCVKVVDLNGTLLQMNPAGLAMVEAAGGAVIGQCVFDVIAPEYAAAYRAFNGHVCRGQSGTLQFEIIGLRGTRRHMETAAVPLPAPGGGFNQLAVTRDVTARVAAERELRESEERYRRERRRCRQGPGHDGPAAHPHGAVHRGVAVTVRDTGIGIPAASLPTIFDMFSQVDRSIERSQGGLGIGLALVKGLVEMHGGAVTAASDGADRGSAFTVWLPVVAPAAESPAGDAPKADRPSAPGRRILVVDDNRDSAVSMAMMPQLLGHQVRTAHDGVEGVEAAEAFRPELILMDVGMPRMNGYEATRRIREQSWGKAVTIVALTGWGQDGDRAQSKTAGCDQHLVKPVSPEDVEKLLRELA